MTAAQRWSCVLVGALLLAVTPALVRHRPVTGSGPPPSVLLSRVEKSHGLAYTGLVRTRGSVPLPDVDRLSGVAGLLGATNRLRVWSQDGDRWRVATLRPTGETDLVHADGRVLEWVYESKTATLSPDAAVRLPDVHDLLPPELARWALGGARAEELGPAPARRVAGREAWGLRLTPDQRGSSIGRVDVYSDAETGLPLAVEVFGRGDQAPLLTTAFEDVSTDPPTGAALRFVPPPDATLGLGPDAGLAAASGVISDRLPPDRLAGLPTRGWDESVVGSYGRGPTVLLAVPLGPRAAEALCQQLEQRPGADRVDEGILLDAAAVRLLLTAPDFAGQSWLLVGTLTDPGLRAAAADLRGDVVVS